MKGTTLAAMKCGTLDQKRKWSQMDQVVMRSRGFSEGKSQGERWCGDCSAEYRAEMYEVDKCIRSKKWTPPRGSAS